MARVRLQSLTGGEGALGAHLREQQQAAAPRQADGLQAVDDSGSGHQVRIHQVAPRCDAVHTVAVLRDHRVADVRELSVFEDEKVCAELDTGLSQREGLCERLFCLSGSGLHHGNSHR